MAACVIDVNSRYTYRYKINYVCEWKDNQVSNYCMKEIAVKDLERVFD